MRANIMKGLSMVMLLVLVLGLFGGTVQATQEALPETLDAPEIILYDSGAYSLDLEVKARTPESVMDFYEKAFVNTYTDENYHTYSDYGDWFGSYGTGIQIDYRIDDGQWQYTEQWDTDLYSCSAYASFNGYYTTDISMGYASEWYSYGIGQVLQELGYLIETTDGSSTYYRFDTENHTITVRARFFVVLYNNSYEEKIILSDWSETASFGQGNVTSSEVPGSLGAPVISDLEIYSTDSYYNTPEARFNILPDQATLDAMLWSEQYDGTLERSELYLIVETSLDPNFGEGSTIVQEYIYEGSSLRRQQYYDDLFYDLWWQLPTSDREAFVWNGETVYIRVKYENERRVSGSWSTIESPYSNVLSLQGPVIGKYDITITHGQYGFDASDYYSESYSITAGRELSSVYCAPLEGCYVETVVVNDVVMYDKADESTYELLDWWDNYTNFAFWGEADYATQDLNIVITYGGTPTEKYGIATECGNGGWLSTDAYYESWNDNSLVVYHGTAPTITIHTYAGFEIDTVLIDGVENAQAKADGFYSFPAITDSSHSICVTFKRVAYRVSSYVYHGTITTDYEGYTGSEYVKIGDDITFTFAPAQDENGNYYEIERVYIDGVLNEEAKTAGSYTFTDVQAEHSISVYYSEDPVITHDITATSSENGRISPEGVIHAREGSTQRFDFIPDEGYEVDQVFVDGVEITNLSTKEYYYIADITETHTIHVTFKKAPVQYTVNVIVSGHNPSVHTVNPAGVTPVWEGESFTVTYSPFVGYEVEKLLVNGTQAEASGIYTIAAVNEDYTIEIFFRIKTYTVTFVDHDGTVLKVETVEHGAQATAPEAPAREHYVFVGWDATFSDVTANVTIRALYEPESYTVTFLSWDGQVLKTETVTYTGDATAPKPPEREGYEFSHWSHDFTNVSCDLEVTAVYVLKEYTVQFLDADGTMLSTQTVKHGEAAVPPADPVREGYVFVGWDSQEYACVTRDLTITAMYVEGEATTYSVTAKALGGGTVTPAGVSSVIEGGSLTVYFQPDAFSRIETVVVDGVEIPLCTEYTFENITRNHTIEVTFVPTAEINLPGEELEHGTVIGHYEIIDGEVVFVVEITPEEGYEVDGIYIDGEPADLEIVDGKYIIRDITEDMEIDVRFRLIEGEGPPKTGERELVLYSLLAVCGALGVALLPRRRGAM